VKVLIGFDPRESEAARVACESLRRVTNGEVTPTFLVNSKLRDCGLLTRPVDTRGGQGYDIASNAPVSTEFAISRFLTPILAQEGWALFTDSDVVFREDPRNMLREVQAKHAVNVVKHAPIRQGGTKMDGQVQTLYARKNWSSVMLFNCDHPANRRLSLRDINDRPGRDLHAFYHLHDEEIGTLDPRWNHLVGVNPDPIPPGGIAHFTLGGPFTPGWAGGPHDDLWLEAAR
jgi:hypothetical protein